MVGRLFWNISDLNDQALRWCDKHNGKYHREIDDIPDFLHASQCGQVVAALREDPEVVLYLFPLRKISFDGFVNYEGRRFGVPFRYNGKTARIARKQDTLYIYSFDLKELLVTHEVTWSKKDSYCIDQFAEPLMPEELPTAPVKTTIQMIAPSAVKDGFDKFNFDEEVIL